MTVAKRVLAGLGLAALAVVVWWAWDHDAMMAWKADAGALPFFAAMAVLPAIGMPITPFFVLAGATFGVGIGLLGSGVALGLNLALCYGIARSGLRPWLESLLQRFEYELPDFEEKKRGALRFTLLVKLTPGAPAVAKNYLLGLTGVPFSLYFVSSMLITGAYAVLCVVVGVSLFEHEIRRSLAIRGGHRGSLAWALVVAQEEDATRQSGGTSIARTGRMPKRFRAFGRKTPRLHKAQAGRTRVSETPLKIRVSDVDLPDGFGPQARKLLGRRLGRFATHIERAMVRFEDINGPRGGVDTVCRIKLTVSHRPTVLVERTAVDAETALRRAATAAAQAMGRSVARAGMATPAPTRPPAPRRADKPASSAVNSWPDDGSLVGRRVGRGRRNVVRAASRPEKRRRDVFIDTAAPGVSETDRKAGGGSSAARNTKLRRAGMGYTLEDSARKPSRKSTRKSANRAKSGSKLARTQQPEDPLAEGSRHAREDPAAARATGARLSAGTWTNPRISDGGRHVGNERNRIPGGAESRRAPGRSHAVRGPLRGSPRDGLRAARRIARLRDAPPRGARRAGLHLLRARHRGGLRPRRSICSTC